MNPEGTYPTAEEALLVPRSQREDKILVRYVKPGWYEWITELDAREMDSYGYEDEYEIVEVAPGE
jgi:hypothetical protein